MAVRLFVLVRPFQVTPPWQSFRDVGGVSRTRHLAWDGQTLRVDDRTCITPASAPSGFGALTFDEGPIAAGLVAGPLPGRSEVQDAFGFASGVFEFAFDVEPLKSGERVLECRPAAAKIARDEPVFDWKSRIRADQWSGNGGCGSAVEAALTATTHILITRSGAALQPGPRRYTRSWIRDGAMMSAALLRMGHAEEVAEFIRWYAPLSASRRLRAVLRRRARSGLAGRARQPRRADRADRRSLPLHRETRTLLEEIWACIERAVRLHRELAGR